jgi:nucleoside-diphosphate-sugar epimerase
MYLVTGATGHVGSPLARQLHERGHSVRAFVRQPDRTAKEITTGFVSIRIIITGDVAHLTGFARKPREFRKEGRTQ